MDMKRFFLNDRYVLGVILLNTLVILLQESGVQWAALVVLDVLCTFFFIVEMVVKHLHYGFRGYWHDGWNCLDGVLTLLSLPSLLLLFFPSLFFNTSFLLALRTLRVFRIFRAGRYFPNLKQIVAGFKLALRQSNAIFLAFGVLLVVIAVVNCCLFRTVAPEYFATPLDSIYAVFQLFTVEGWYEIPNAITAHLSPGWVHVVRIYFCILLIGGGIIGMSFINSIFVDAMAADNNDDIKAQLSRMEAKLDEMARRQDKTEE